MNTSNVEASIIGSLILYPELFQEAAKVLIPTRQSGVRVFREHNRIWDWMVKAQFEQMRGWDVQLVSSKFKDVPELIRQAEPETLSSSILYLREEYERAVLKKVCEDALQRLGEESPYSVASDVLSNLTDEEPEVKEKLRGDEIFEALKSLQKGEVGVDTIWPNYNKTVGGLGKGDILILAGSPGSGKTEELLKEFIHLAKQGKPCALFSLELTKEAIYHRLFKIESGIPMKVLRSRRLNPATGELELVLSEQDATKLAEAVKVIASIPLFVHDVSEVTNRVPVIIQKIKWHYRNNNLFAFGIDYLQLAVTGNEKIDNGGNDIKIFERVSKALDNVTKSLKISAIWISKLNREVVTRGGSKEPKMSDLFGSSTLEYIAAAIMFIYRPLAYAEMKNFEKEDGSTYRPFDRKFIIAKNRPQGGLLDEWWDWQEEDSNSYSSDDLVPSFESYIMPRVDPDAELPF